MKKLLGLFLLSTSALAAPNQIEVWILSNSKTSHVEHLLSPTFKKFSATAQLACEPMGEYCFDPQVGLYKKDDMDAAVEVKEVIDTSGPAMAHGRSLDRSLIDCDKSNFFDVFCGKAKEEKKKSAKLEIWVDTSSSMKEFDYSDDNGGCYRKSLLTRLDESCGFNEKVSVMQFDTSLKEAGTMESLCNNRGLNDYKRMIDWIERSEVKKLIIITDIYELQKDFADFIASKNGKIIGDRKPFTAKELLDKVDELAKVCK